MIPLRAGQETYGLLQLGSRRKHALNADTVAVLEPVVDVISAFLHQLITDETRRLGEAHYRALFENMSEAFAYCRILYDAEGAPFDWVFVAVNEAFCTLFDVHDVVGERASALFPGVIQIQPERLQGFARVAATGKPEKEESFFALHGLWLETSVSSPAAGHFLAVFRDHTERRRIGEALRRSQFSLDNVADYPVWSDVDGHIVEVSESTCRQLQYSREELLSMTLFDIDPGLSAGEMVGALEPDPGYRLPLRRGAAPQEERGTAPRRGLGHPFHLQRHRIRLRLLPRHHRAQTPRRVSVPDPALGGSGPRSDQLGGRRRPAAVRQQGLLRPARLLRGGAHEPAHLGFRGRGVPGAVRGEMEARGCG